jgi:GxxExxY protein
MKLVCLSREVIACAMKVHRSLGCGFLEVVYERALAVELKRRSIEFRRQASFPVFYENQPVGTFISDFVVENQLILELKATNELIHAFHAQLLNYLKASSLELGLLLNFGTTSLQIKRMANTQKAHPRLKQFQEPITK